MNLKINSIVLYMSISISPKEYNSVRDSTRKPNFTSTYPMWKPHTSPSSVAMSEKPIRHVYPMNRKHFGREFTCPPGYKLVPITTKQKQTINNANRRKMSLCSGHSQPGCSYERDCDIVRHFMTKLGYDTQTVNQCVNEWNKNPKKLSYFKELFGRKMAAKTFTDDQCIHTFEAFVFNNSDKFCSHIVDKNAEQIIEMVNKSSIVYFVRNYILGASAMDECIDYLNETVKNIIKKKSENRSSGFSSGMIYYGGGFSMVPRDALIASASGLLPSVRQEEMNRSYRS